MGWPLYRSNRMYAAKMRSAGGLAEEERTGRRVSNADWNDPLASEEKECAVLQHG